MLVPVITSLALLATIASAVDPLGTSNLFLHCNERHLTSPVDLTYAKYQGLTLQNGVNHWLSLRFAAPPTGSLRFAAPQPPVTQSSIQDATKVRTSSFLLGVIAYREKLGRSPLRCSQ